MLPGLTAHVTHGTESALSQSELLADITVTSPPLGVENIALLDAMLSKEYACGADGLSSETSPPFFRMSVLPSQFLASVSVSEDVGFVNTRFPYRSSHPRDIVWAQRFVT